MADPVTITLIAGIVVSSVGSLVAIFRKNIRRSKCFGNEIEFRTNKSEDNEVPSHPQVIVTPANDTLKTPPRSPRIDVREIHYLPDPSRNIIPLTSYPIGIQV